MKIVSEILKSKSPHLKAFFVAMPMCMRQTGVEI
jgi:hypothetical protein